jgi:Protein of unknown function (DUF3553)
MSKPSHPMFQFGDSVRHIRRPEWGTGSVTKTELVSVNGHQVQRLTIRFANAGLKTLSTAHAELEPVVAEDHGIAEVPQGVRHTHDAPAMDIWKNASEPGWLEPLARRKIEEQMTALPMEVRDLFNNLEKRLRLMLELYRFDRTGGKLLDWAVAQSGLKDPLSRFTRHDLERLFDRWAFDRDTLLSRLLVEARTQPALLKRLQGEALPAARHAVSRINARMLS